MDTLTDRYIWAVLRRIPRNRRSSIAKTLRAELDEVIAAQVSVGVDPRAAEAAVIAEFGDPDRRAADIAGSPRSLIGPDWYFDYRRLITVVLAAVAPSVFGGLVLAQALAGQNLGQSVVTALSVAFTATVQVGFWITVAFAVIERVSQGRRPRPDTWDASDLPSIPTVRIGLGETIFAVLAYLILGGLLLAQGNIWVVETAGGDPLPLLDPALWGFWIPWFLSLAVLEIGFALAAYAIGRWTWPLAWANLALNLAFAVPAIWLIASRAALSAEFLETFRSAEPLIDAAITIVPFAIAVVAVLDIVSGFRKAYRSSTQLATSGAEPVDRAAPSGR